MNFMVIVSLYHKSFDSLSLFARDAVPLDRTDSVVERFCDFLVYIFQKLDHMLIASKIIARNIQNLQGVLINFDIIT